MKSADTCVNFHPGLHSRPSPYSKRHKIAINNLGVQVPMSSDQLGRTNGG